MVGLAVCIDIHLATEQSLTAGLTIASTLRHAQGDTLSMSKGGYSPNSPYCAVQRWNTLCFQLQALVESTIRSTILV